MLPTSQLRPLRACICIIHELEKFVDNLRPGTVVLAKSVDAQDAVHAVRRLFDQLGIEGCGTGDGRVYWGVYQPARLSSDAIINSHFKNAGLVISPVNAAHH
jgi:hypothetical protein